MQHGDRLSSSLSVGHSSLGGGGDPGPPSWKEGLEASGIVPAGVIGSASGDAIAHCKPLSRFHQAL